MRGACVRIVGVWGGGLRRREGERAWVAKESIWDGAYQSSHQVGFGTGRELIKLKCYCKRIRPTAAVWPSESDVKGPSSSKDA